LAAGGDGDWPSAFLFLTLHLMAMRNEVIRRRVRAMQIQAARNVRQTPSAPLAGKA
jgi:hypothetical protein